MEETLVLGVETLVLSKDTLLTFGVDSLVIPDRQKKRGFCGLSITEPKTTTKSIPYYNVLWAHVTDDRSELVVEYAQATSKRLLAVETKRFVLPESADDLNVDIDQWVESLLSRAYANAARNKRAWVLVNPHAGPGGADKIWEQQVRPIFYAARMPLTLHRTTYGGEAVKLAEELNIDEFDVSVACSGDGMPHEVFNGLAKRPDARRALAKIAVCQIPCGSGNAMSCNLYGTHHASVAALAIVKGVPTPLDLVSITQGNKRYVSFLSQAFGMMADLDIMTEHLRWMGHHRFTYGFLKLAIKKQTYPCDIAFQLDMEDKDHIKQHYRNKVHESGSEDYDESAMPSSASAKSRANDDSRKLSMGRTDTSQSSQQEDDLGLPPLRYGTINDEIPSGWHVIPHEKLGSFYCGNMAYMAPDLNFFSAAFADDGYMDVLTMDGDVSLMQHIELQLSVESGSFFDNPLVKYRKVTAYRLIPRTLDKGGVISIDGELVDFAPFQAEVHQGLALTLSKNKGFEAPGPLNWDKVTNHERLMA